MPQGMSGAKPVSRRMPYRLHMAALAWRGAASLPHPPTHTTRRLISMQTPVFCAWKEHDRKVQHISIMEGQEERMVGTMTVGTRLGGYGMDVELKMDVRALITCRDDATGGKGYTAGAADAEEVVPRLYRLQRKGRRSETTQTSGASMSAMMTSWVKMFGWLRTYQ